MSHAACRQRFHYLIAPSARLLTSVLSLSSSDLAAAESALHVADELAQQQLTVSLKALTGDIL